MGKSPVLVSGLPGSGKSTLAAQWARRWGPRSLADAVGPAFNGRLLGGIATELLRALSGAGIIGQTWSLG